MSESSSKHHNRDAVGSNETIFDFLKRKKQFNLQNTLQKSFTHSNSHTKRKADLDLEDDFPQTRDLTKYRTHDSNRQSHTARQTVTPQKLQFDQPRPVNRSATKQEVQPAAPTHNRRTKSFLSMISPIKNRSSSVVEEREENQGKARSVVKVGKGEGKSESHARGKVSKCISSIKETVNYLNENVKKIRDRSHGLAVLFNPVLNRLTDPSDPLARQAGQLRNKLKALQSLINGVSIENCDQMVQNFHRTLEEHLQSELSQLRRGMEKQNQGQLSHIAEDKQAKIDRLQQELRKVNKENDLLSRRLDVADNSRGQLEEVVEERENIHVEQLDRFKENYSATLEQLKSRNSQLEERCRVAEEQAREAEKNCKNQRMVKESLSNRYSQEIQQIAEAKDAYLLNEIMVLKAEFTSDMARVTEMQHIKEAELLGRIDRGEEELSKRTFQKGCDKQIESKILEQASQLRQENVEMKRQSQCLVTDMYRLNEELYQHWMGLKDMKLLSTRLGSFPQFRKIYEDLRFNEHLFH